MPARRKDTAAAFDLFWIPEPNSGCWLYGMERTTIQKIRKRQPWKHVA